MRLIFICTTLLVLGAIISKCCAEQYWMIDQYGYMKKFFYDEENMLMIRKDGHTYLPVLFEHDSECPFCQAMQSDGRL